MCYTPVVHHHLTLIHWLPLLLLARLCPPCAPHTPSVTGAIAFTATMPLDTQPRSDVDLQMTDCSVPHLHCCGDGSEKQQRERGDGVQLIRTPLWSLWAPNGDSGIPACGGCWCCASGSLPTCFRILLC
jgi:hypothetical protein